MWILYDDHYFQAMQLIASNLLVYFTNHFKNIEIIDHQCAEHSIDLAILKMNYFTADFCLVHIIWL